MNKVNLMCRDCDTQVEFASAFMRDDKPTIEEMQQHMDTQFVARCGHCFACNWEVTAVNPVNFELWVLDRDEPIMLTIPEWMQAAEKSTVQ